MGFGCGDPVLLTEVIGIPHLVHGRRTKGPDAEIFPSRDLFVFFGEFQVTILNVVLLALFPFQFIQRSYLSFEIGILPTAIVVVICKRVVGVHILIRCD